jgi:hypothetical protein
MDRNKAAALLLTMLLAPCAQAKTSLESLGGELAAAAKRADARHVAFPPFEVPAGVAAEAGSEAAQAVLRGFVRTEASRAVERENLGQILSERKLAWAGAVAGPELPKLAAADAVVVGRLLRTASGWKADARLVSVAGGVVLGAASVDLKEAPEMSAAPITHEDEAFPPLAALRERADSFAGVATVEILEDWLRRSDLPASRRAPAALALADAGPGSELALGEALHDPEPLVRLCAALGLGKMRAAWAEGALRRMLSEDDSWMARYGAATALGRIGSPTATTALAAALASDGAWQVRQQAAHALASRGVSRPAASALVRALQDKEPTVRRAAGAAMAEWNARADG